jgi:uncharacterized protein YcbX
LSFRSNNRHVTAREPSPGRTREEVRTVEGTVSDLWVYPVKSLQGASVAALEIGPGGVVGDRTWGFVDEATTTVASAKRHKALLEAEGHADRVVLPDGRELALDDPATVGQAMSDWLARPMRLIRSADQTGLAYEMTFDPPDDSAELFEIPMADGSLLDLAHVHVVVAGTLAHCAAQRPDLDWDVRRFRPNVVVDLPSEPFAENAWAGRRLRLGDAVLTVSQPTVRCAMPLRAQPGLDRQPELFRAINELNGAMPNHLGIYLEVTTPGRVALGDQVQLD